MGKFSCCVPNCTNNWRNSPNLKFHTLPGDLRVREEYVRLIKNDTLRVDAQNTRICGAHFPDGERMCRTQLPSIFPWKSVPVKCRRVIEKHDLPRKAKKRLVMVPEEDESDADGERQTQQQPIESTLSSEIELVHVHVDLDTSKNECLVEYQKEDTKEVEDLKEEISSLKKELLEMKSANNKPKFDLDDYKQ
jgi:hypothetical protein